MVHVAWNGTLAHLFLYGRLIVRQKCVKPCSIRRPDPSPTRRRPTNCMMSTPGTAGPRALHAICWTAASGARIWAAYRGCALEQGLSVMQRQSGLSWWKKDDRTPLKCTSVTSHDPRDTPSYRDGQWNFPFRPAMAQPNTADCTHQCTRSACTCPAAAWGLSTTHVRNR